MRTLYIVLSLLVLASMVLTACGDQPTPVAPQPTRAPTQHPTPVADLYLYFSEQGLPQTEGAMKDYSLIVWLAPGVLADTVSATLTLENGVVYALEPNPEQTPLPGLIGGTQLMHSELKSSTGDTYKCDDIYDHSILCIKQP